MKHKLESRLPKKKETEVNYKRKWSNYKGQNKKKKELQKQLENKK